MSARSTRSTVALPRQPLIRDNKPVTAVTRFKTTERLSIPILDSAGQPVGKVESEIDIKAPELLSPYGHKHSNNYGDLALTVNILNDYQLNITTLASQADRIKQLQDEQRKIEEEYFKEGFACPVDQLNSIRDRISTVDPTTYKNILRERFYDASIMKAAMCTAESIAYMPPLEGGNISANIRIKKWIRGLHRINSDTADGYAMKTGLNNTNDTFIIKAPREDKNLMLLHEYFVGVYGLNKLRTHIPNFAYVLGGFKCSAPIIDDRNDVVAWCNNNDYPVDYVIYENITPGDTLSNIIIKGCTFDEWLGYYMQILYSLEMAFVSCDFTHYDLHTDNVIIRVVPAHLKVKGRFHIPYPTENNQLEYISASSVATIIDYGLAHIKYKGRSFGAYDKMHYGVLPNKGFPLFDAYKLLMFSLKYMSEVGDNNLFNLAANILKFFNNVESPQEVLAKQAETYYYLPYTPALANLSIFNLTTYIRQIYNMSHIISAQVSSGEEVLGCTLTKTAGNMRVCADSMDFYRSIGLAAQPVAHDIFDFYDIITRLADEHTDESKMEIDRIVKKFDYNEARLRALNNYNILVLKLNALVLGGTIDTIRVEPMTIMKLYVPTENFNINNLFNEETLRMYKDYAYRVAEIYETMQGITVMHNALVYAADVYCDTELLEDVAGSYDQLRRDIEPTWKVILEGIIADVNYTRMLISPENKVPIAGININNPYKYINDQIKLYPKFKWWWRNLPDILNVINVPII